MTTPYYADDGIKLHHGDSLKVLQGMPDGSVNSCVTSPPYFGLRDYGIEGQYGLEATPAEYVETMRVLFAEVRRVLAADGTLWLNLGDSYSVTHHGVAGKTATLASGTQSSQAVGGWSAGARAPLPQKNLMGMPWRVAFALQDEGWILRNEIIWNKPNAMPESVTDRLACRHEHLFLFAKSPRYWFDLDPIREALIHPDALDGSRVFGGANKGTEGGVGAAARRRGQNRYGAARPWANSEQGDDHDAASPRGRNPGDVWTITTKPFSEAHFAVMPPDLAERCIVAGCKPNGVVLDPFSGSGTTGMVAQRTGRKYVGIDLNRDYLDMSLRTRLQQGALDFDGAA